MKYYRILIIWVLLLIHSSFNAYAIESAENVKSLKVAVNKSSYPYHYINDEHQPAGLMVDFWRAWGEKQQVSIEFVVSDWDTTIANAANGVVDVHPGLAITSHRLTEFSFVKSFFERNSYIFIHTDIQNIEVIDNITPYTVGVVSGSSHIEKLTTKFPHIQLREFPSRYQLYQAALNKDIMAFAGLDHVSKQFEDVTTLQNLYPVQKRILYDNNLYNIAVAKKNSHLVPLIEDGFSKFTQNEISALEQKWLATQSASDVVRVTLMPDIPPFMSVSATGEPGGLFIDMWQLWAEHNDAKVEFVFTDLYSGIQSITQRKSDIHFINPLDSVSNKSLNVLDQIYAIESQVFVLNEIEGATSLSDIPGKTIGMVSLAPFAERLSMQYPDVKFKKYDFFKDIFSAAQRKEIDGFIGTYEYVTIQLLKNNLQSSFYPLDSPSIITPLYPMISVNKPELIGLVTEGFSKIPIHELEAIEKVWLTKPEGAYFTNYEKRVLLSEEELLWRDQQGEVKVGVLRDFAPIGFFDIQGKFSGINGDILRLISERTLLNFNYVPFDNWQALFSALQNKQVDMIGNATPTPEREKSLSFSDSYWDMPWVVMHPRRMGENLDANDFAGKTIAILKGYHLVSKLNEKYPNIVIKLVDSVDEGLLAVQRGVVDGFIENIATVSELLKKQSLVQLTISVLDTLAIDKSHFAVRQDMPELTNILNKGLSSIDENARQGIYESWFDINIETGLDKAVVTQVSVQVGLVLAIVFVVIVVKNRRLNREIDMRKQLESQMKYMATHDELTGLANRVLLKDRLNRAISFHQRQDLILAVLFLDLDGFKDVNDNYGHDVGDELLKAVSEKLKQCVRDSDTVVRFGGDEFVLLLTGLHKSNEVTFVAEKVLQTMSKSFELPVNEHTVTVNIGCSIGIALYPDDGTTDNDLLKVADTLMYEVKANGKNHFLFNRDI